MTPDKFWTYVDRSAGADACWPWTAARLPSGYGVLWFEGRDTRAHRVALGLTDGLGTTLEAPLVLHSCDNPPCCNPAHLSRGTQSDNIRDMWRRGRHAKPKGTPRGRLPKATVMAIRESRLSVAKTARAFGVGATTVWEIQNGRRYKEDES